jgi:hypothetical protein
LKEEGETAVKNLLFGESVSEHRFMISGMNGVNGVNGVNGMNGMNGIYNVNVVELERYINREDSAD